MAATSAVIQSMLFPEEKEKTNVQVKANAYLVNPLLKKDGSLANKYLNYDGLLNNPNTNSKMKQYIMEATGLTPKVEPVSFSVSGGSMNEANNAPISTASDGGNGFQQGAQTPSGGLSSDGMNNTDYVKLIAEGEKYLGMPYVWGGSTPSQSFDCSGLISWVYNNSGVKNIPRTTAQGYYDRSKSVSTSEAQPGDLIFFQGTYNSPDKVTHIGIYVGDGKMLHAGSNKGVSYANINDPYWQQHLYGFGRLQ